MVLLCWERGKVCEIGLVRCDEIGFLPGRSDDIGPLDGVKPVLMNGSKEGSAGIPHVENRFDFFFSEGSFRYFSEIVVRDEPGLDLR